MAEIDCRDSPAVQKGETWATYLCNITVDNVYDTNSGKITVTPSVGSNNTPQTLNVTQGDHYDFTTNAEGFRVYVTSIFVGDGGTKIMRFTVCELTSSTPLAVTALDLVYKEAVNSVDATVTIAGEGYGTLRMTWGSEGSEDTAGLGAGTYTLGHWLPGGTHEICAEVIS